MTDENDSQQLAPMMQQVQDTFGRTADVTVADSGYDSNEQLAQVEAAQQSVLVAQQPDSNAGPFAKAHFTYDPVNDVFHCPQGRRLPLLTSRAANAHRGYACTTYRCQPEGCPARSACTSSKHGRSVFRTEHDDVRARMGARLAEPENRILMSLRKEVVEHVFGQMKGNQGFRRFLGRGKKNAEGQWVLASLAHNLWKLWTPWKEGRFEVKKAV